MCAFCSEKKSKMAPGIKIWKREAEPEAEETLSEAATTLGTKIFGHKHPHLRTTTESEFETGKLEIRKNLYY